MSDRVAQRTGRSQTGRVARAQALLFVTTGLWPVAHRRSFEFVTGPKIDFWLARTVGLLLAAIGATLWLAAERDEVDDRMRMLGASTAAVLTGIDVYYVAKRRIRPIYLVDAAAETGLVAAWALSRKAS